MSRICVKNLPKYVDEDRIRDFFSRKGEITDAKLMRTKDGKSRQFAFVGFRTEMEAQETLSFFNNTYMDTCKITCEVARGVNDPNLPRPWSRYSATKDSTLTSENKENKSYKVQKSSASEAKGSGFLSNEAKDSKDHKIVDPQLQEFLEVMQPRAKSKLWANDMFVATPPTSQDLDAHSEENKLPKNNKKQSTKMFNKATDRSEVEKQMKIGTSSGVHSKEFSETTPLDSHKDDAMSDMEYCKSRMKKNWSDSETDDEKSEASMDDLPSESPEVDAEDQEVDPMQPKARHEETEERISEYSDVENNDDNKKPTSFSGDDDNKQALENRRLFIRNLPYTTTEDDLTELFSQFGEVSQVHLVVDKNTRRSKGFAYVLYTLPEAAVRALEELDNSIFQGRLLHVMPAKPQNAVPEKLDSEHGMAKQDKNFKQLRQEQRKAAETSGNTQAWNSLFMRPETVVENIVRKLGISKSEFLEQEADDLAVRIALGETHVIAETKKSLSGAGVNVAALEEYASKKTENPKRSNHVILVKNLPYNSGEADLANLFGKFGTLDKIILPPTRTLALVIFLEAAEARAAFKGLAYKRYKDAPLYLEWAPDNILSPNTTSEGEEQKHVVGEEIVKKVLLEQSVEGVPEEEIDPDRTESRSVFVKNLNFKTSDESLRKHFCDIMKNGTIKSVKVKKHLKNGNSVSAGFGFIEFDSVDTATNVCKNLQGTVLDGHALILQLCHLKKTGQVSKKDEKDKSTTKLIVRNVAFEATEKDLKQLFSPFGKIKSLRLPMKFGKHRGFAFVEFVTKQEAQKAVEALSSTHLYGRHLVIEKAKEGETLEELRARVAAHFDEHSGSPKLSRKRKQMTL